MVKDWNLEFKKDKLIIEPNQLECKKKKNSAAKIIKFYIDLDIHHFIEYGKDSYQNLLYYIGILIN